MSCRRRLSILALVCLTAGLAVPGTAGAAQSRSGTDNKAVAGLRAALGTDAKISVHPATGVARFVSLPAGKAGSLSPATSGAPQQKATAFFVAQGAAFGIRDAARELALRGNKTDQTGMTHLDYEQVYAGVPVYAALLKAHFDRAGALRTVNGVFVPGINVNPVPTLGAADAGQVALAAVAQQKQPEKAPSVKASRLFVYRVGLAKGVPGPNHLVYEVEVTNQRDVREFVYVDAHSGRVVDQVTGIHEALNRRVHNQSYGNVVWQEGDPLPHPNVDINNIITFTGHTYNMFSSTFGRDSYDGAGHQMESVNDDPAIQCPNANWNGTTTNYCTGVTGDDTIGHEWGHAYTEYTHNLIYAWQPGALNESYSDIWGEVVDTVNGPNLPDTARIGDACSQFGGTPPPTLTITGGPAAGTYFAVASVNEPTPPFTIGPTAMAISSPPGACTAVTGVSGKVAIIDWTLNAAGGNECGSVVRATNALNAGATGIIFVASEELGLLNLGSINTIGSVQVTHEDGTTIKGGLPADATISLGVGTDNTYRWLSGEDDTDGGAIRDMWNPTCFGDPARVTPGFYACGTGDGGGVHTNSGVSNHTFALMVDGGTYNGQTITGIGMTRAAHIYFRAMTVYQGPASDFVEHADSLETSCNDLVTAGTPLTDLFGGPPVPITAAHCTEVHETTLATGLRASTDFCNFEPVLDPNTPPACPAGSTQTSIFSADFETNPFPAWTATHVGVNPEFTPRDWTWSNALPAGEPGSALFGTDPINGTCAPGGDESGVLSVTSPSFTVPVGAAPRLAFRHWVATELDFDGGHLFISVNGGPFTPVAPQDFTFNSYNGALVVAQNTNPYAGQPAFHGSDEGSVVGSWGTSHVNLAPYASAGSSVRLRFDMSTDGCNGNVGWYVDNVNVFHCSGAGAHSLSIADAAVVEGNAGPVQVTASVTLSSPDTVPITVDFATADGLATTANNDYTAVTGTLTFAPGQTSRAVTVSVIGDTTLEPPENFFVNLSNATGSTINDGQASVTIINDDGGGTGVSETKSELSHGYRTVRALNNTTQSNMFWIQTQAASSYEVVVDATSGDINAPAGGPDVQRLAVDGSTVLGTAVPVGTGPARSLRWQTSTSGAVNLVRVRSADCTTNCGTDDTYRLRSYETTYTIPRFNNTGSQVTVLLLQNPSNDTVNATVYFYNASGTQLVGQAVSLAPKQLQIVNTASIPQANGQSGTIVVTHDGAYGSLAGKTVALEPSTGFSFDSPMQPRNR
jgi:Zn-dependent metalloprotease